MMNKNLITGFVLGLIITSISGCGKGNETHQSEVSTKTADENAIKAKCVVTYYSPNGLVYISEQNHSIYPDSDKLIITAKESFGHVRCKIQDYDYSIRTNASPYAKAIYNRVAVRAILNGILAGAGLADTGGTEVLEKVKLDGRWYEPLVMTSESSDWAKITYLRNIETKSIDIVLVEEEENGAAYAARCYNYSSMSECKRFPMKVDILRFERIPGGLVSLGRMLEFSYQHPIEWAKQ